eukprot:g48819.t1
MSRPSSAAVLPAEEAALQVDSSLLFEDQDLETLFQAGYWLALCPWLHVSFPENSQQQQKQKQQQGERHENHYNHHKQQQQQKKEKEHDLQHESQRRQVEAANGGCVKSLPNEATNYLRSQLVQRGFFGLTAKEQKDFLGTFLPEGMMRALAMAVLRLQAHGLPPTAILVYDEAWWIGEWFRVLFQQLAAPGPLPSDHPETNAGKPAAAAAQTSAATSSVSFIPNGDWFTFHVGDGSVYMPGGPHRDRPNAGPESFCPNTGLPKYVSIWLALTDATVSTSCLYVVPRPADASYLVPGDSLKCLTEPGVWGQVLAQPLPPGGFLAFSHRLVHWGSQPQPSISLARLPVQQHAQDADLAARGECSAQAAQNGLAASPLRKAAQLSRTDLGARRIALTLAFADPSFERPYFPVSYLPHPPTELRVALVAAQSLHYPHFAKDDRHRIALYRRIFQQQKHFFAPWYVDKVMNAAQWQTFLLSRAA